VDQGFASLHPAPCFVYYVSLVILSMVLYHPLFLLPALFSMLLLNYLQDGGARLKGSLKAYLLLGLLLALFNPLLSHRGETILFYFRDNPITLEAIAYGITMMLSLVTVLVTFVSYNQTITPDKFMYLFASLCPQTAFLAMLTTRFVPFLKVRSEQINQVQKAQGIDITRGSLKERLTNGMAILSILVMWSLEEAIETAQSMRARGYGSSRRRTSYFSYAMTRRDWLSLALTVISASLLLLLWQAGYQHYQIYPKVAAPGWERETFLFFLVSGIYLGIPLVLEWWDRYTWR
jgi:energy-coupling factor transport system permease protein